MLFGRKGSSAQPTLVPSGKYIMDDSGHLVPAQDHPLHEVWIQLGWTDDLTRARSIIAKGLQIVQTAGMVDRHFFYSAAAQALYVHREADARALPEAEDMCRRQIGLAPKAIPVLKALWGQLPGHYGYKQLAVILEKQKRYDEALAVVDQAEREGWSGDWPARRDRLQKKLNKQARKPPLETDD